MSSHNTHPYSSTEQAASELRARMEALFLKEAFADSADKQRADFGMAIVQHMSVQLIPSDHLADNQVMVSRAVYNATKERLGL